MATNFGVKIGLFTFIRRPGTRIRIAILPFSDFKKFICDDLAILFVNFVNSGPVTSEYKKVKSCTPSFLPLK